MKQLWISKVFLWSLERFPPVQILSAFLTFAITCIPLENFENSNWVYLKGTIIVYIILLTLRILDEHKDFKNDQIAHPERRLQKGLITLKDLKILAFGSTLIFIYLLSTFDIDMGLILSAIAVFGWMTLMSFEFFVPKWLNRNLIIYSVSHLLISPLIIYFCSHLVNTHHNEHLPLMMGISFLSAFSYEVCRKIKGKDELIESELNYSNSYGYIKPITLFLVITILNLIVSMHYQSKIAELSSWNILFYIIGIVLTLFSGLYFLKHPLKKSRKLNEGISAFVSIVSFAIPMGILFK